jgi:hypothetical protein
MLYPYKFKFYGNHQNNSKNKNLIKWAISHIFKNNQR